jgi:hypothetical protein
MVRNKKGFILIELLPASDTDLFVSRNARSLAEYHPQGVG